MLVRVQPRGNKTRHNEMVTRQAIINNDDDHDTLVMEIIILITESINAGQEGVHYRYVIVNMK